MNKEFTYINGQVIVRDEEDNQKQLEYYDNLKDVLVQENIVETMENDIKKLEKVLEELTVITKTKYFPIIFISTSVVTILVLILLYFFDLQPSLAGQTIKTMIGSIDKSTIFAAFLSLSCISFGAYIDFVVYNGYYKDAKKEAKAVSSEIEFLKKAIVAEKEELEELKNKKTKEKENEEKQLEVQKVDDNKQLRILNEYKNLYYNLGLYFEKYSNYYKKGVLEEKMKKYYNENGIGLVMEYMEENTPKLEKKLKQDNKKN